MKWGMLTRFALWVRLLFRLFEAVKLESKWVDRVKEQHEAGQVVHVCEVLGLLDFALLNYLFLKHQLPLAGASNVRLNVFFRPLVLWFVLPFALVARLFKRTVRLEQFEAELGAGASALIFLKRARFVVFPGSNIGNDYLRSLVKLQRGRDRPVILLPHVIFWSKGPAKYRQGLLDLLLGDPSAPGIRKLLTFIMRPSRVHVTSGEPVNLKEALAEAAGQDDENAARKVSWMLHRSIDRTEKVTRGPMLKSAQQMKAEMMANPDFEAAVETIGREMSLRPRAARQRAARNIMEIAADFRGGYIEFLSLVLTPIFKRVFSGFVVDREAIQTIREASKDSAVVLVPCHRSHIDYLVISYLMYFSGLVPPHIAAGANLSFFPVGHIFRHTGAFFIRRKIGPDKMYAYVLSQYIRKLLKEGFSVEFFIEGGRSRTGKNMPPRFGLLNYVAEAVCAEAVQNITIIPMALSYERIAEAEGYAQELVGGEKRKEDIAGLVRSAEVLDSRFGRLYLTAGRPIKVADFFSKGLDKPPSQLTEEERRYMVKKLGYMILGRINRATVVNPTGLVAAVLLSHLKRGVSYSRFLDMSGFLIDFAVRRGYPISLALDRGLRAGLPALARARERADREGNPRLVTRSMGEALAQMLDETVEKFAGQGHIASEPFADEPVISVKPGARIHLNYYRNNVIHVFQREALVSLVLYARKGESRIAVKEVEADLEYLSRLFKKEFIFRVGEFERGIMAGLGALAKHDLISSSNGTVTVVPENLDRLLLLRNMVLPVAESYVMCARYVPHLPWRSPMREKELVRAVLERARKDYQQGEVTCQEALSSVSITNSLDRYKSMGLLVPSEPGSEAGKMRLADVGAREELARIERRLTFFTDVK
jgi:glycerol-3-phosphate O-acyltransferase